MIDKGIISEAGTVRSGKTYARLFKADFTMQEYLSMQIKNSKAYIQEKGPLISGLFAALLDDDEIKSKTINELEEIIAKKKKEFAD